MRPPGRKMLRLARAACAVFAPPSTRIACSPPPTCARPPGASRLILRSCCVHFHRREPERLHAAGSSSTRISRSTPPPRCTCATPLTCKQALGDGVVDEPAELLFRHVGRADGVIDERAALDVDALDQRLLDPFRQVAADLGDRHRARRSPRDRPGVPIWNSMYDKGRAFHRRLK